MYEHPLSSTVYESPKHMPSFYYPLSPNRYETFQKKIVQTGDKNPQMGHKM